MLLYEILAVLSMSLPSFFSFFVYLFMQTMKQDVEYFTQSKGCLIQIHVYIIIIYLFVFKRVAAFDHQTT